MYPQYIIVQAGGKGTRLENLTTNKPKALVPVGNLPMLFHLFRQFPQSRFIVIADYKARVMHRYLSAFADVQYLVVDAAGAKGTCGGLGTALNKVPHNEPFMLIWSDLVLPKDFSFPEEEGDYIGLSRGFSCRWRYVDDRFEEVPSDSAGVAGLFIFRDKNALANVPKEGEFVKWLQSQKREFSPLTLEKTREYGLLSSLADQNESSVYQCRPFNQINTSPDGKTIVKEGIDDQGRALAAREKAWYRFVADRGFTHIPHVYSYDPFVMERINGRNIFDYNLDTKQKRVVLHKLIQCLRQLHSLESVQTDYFSIFNAYVKKTWDRLDKIRDLVPFADQEAITVNGRRCRNVFFHKQEIEDRFAKYTCKKFVLLHGDNTFSNMMLNERMEPVLIDPRGYFGYTELYGDPLYDWAKLYYSLVGNYDQFNQKRFRLAIGAEDVTLSIRSNGWEDMEDAFFEELGEEVDRQTLMLLHAIIWLSLTTYAWEDYDSICGAFYNGLYYLEEIL